MLLNNWQFIENEDETLNWLRQQQVNEEFNNVNNNLNTNSNNTTSTSISV